MIRKIFLNLLVFVIFVQFCDSQSSNSSNVSAIDVTLFPGQQCERKCGGSRPRICYFKWVMEHYHAMGPACGECAQGVLEDCFKPDCLPADGFERGVMSINRKIPGPPINVCKNDLIVVDITNAMGGTAATIHWHGFHQKDTPEMDGVPFITQCPIDFATTFRYAFRATQSGTQFYHSHSGHHKVNGQYGSIVVREPEADDPNSDLYDFDLPEHTILIADWMHEDGEFLMPGLPSSVIQPVNVLINGKGVFTNEYNETTPTPIEVFKVKKGGSYRFRMINAASHVCPVQVQIENHRMEIIASDSYHLKNQTVDTLISTSGERYDFILHADQPSDDYWIRVQILGNCEGREIQQYAMLTYNTSASLTDESKARPTKYKPDYDDKYPFGVHINHPNTTCYDLSIEDLCIGDFSSATPGDFDLLNNEPDTKIYLSFDNYRVSPLEVFIDKHYSHFMNLNGDRIAVGAVSNISFAFPSFPVLTQPEDITDDTFCHPLNLPEKCNGRRLCTCTQNLFIELNSTVELTIVDKTTAINNVNHPFHLHGYQFYVTEMFQLKSKEGNIIPMSVDIAKRMDLTKSFPQHEFTEPPPYKDTVSIPSKGLVKLRFRATNPGFWLMHCHFEWHTAVGMSILLQVGETSEHVKPPENFPKCGNYVPKIKTL
uniref:Putative laccase 2 n=1 Tax=Corethrella appendiculata TaxID=1370023 RepID=U5EZN5_9DIPT